jgi:hypothetical protein
VSFLAINTKPNLMSSCVNPKLFTESEAFIRYESGVAVRRDRLRRFGEWQRRFGRAKIGSAQSLLVRTKSYRRFLAKALPEEVLR